MIGFPNNLNSKEDVQNLISLYPDEVKAYLQTLLAGRFAWMVSGELAEGETGIEDDTHRVITEDRETGPVRLQMELREDPEAQLFRMGLTISNVQELFA